MSKAQYVEISLGNTTNNFRYFSYISFSDAGVIDF